MGTSSENPQPRQDGRGAANSGPRNVMLERQNPDLLVPPVTDGRLVPNLKFSFSMAHTRIEKGGWTRECRRSRNSPS
jgi:oxalate decarboxylase